MHGFPPHFLRNWPLIRTHSHITAQARRYKVFAALTVGSVQRMLLEALQRLFIPQFCIEYQVIVPSGQVEANFNAQQAVDSAPAWWQRNFVKTSKLQLLDAVLLQRRYISRTKYGGSSQLPLFRRFLFLRQHRTIPALRLKHRSGSCGTASALPKCSIMSGCGTRIVLRGKSPSHSATAAPASVRCFRHWRRSPLQHPVLSALLAWHLPHLARRIGT